MTGASQDWSARWPLIVGFATIFLLFGGLGAWGFGTRLSGAVVASGLVETKADRQIVQHPDGGVVTSLSARDGDRVAAGDILLQLDGTYLSSERSVVLRQLLELQARMARLRAERDGDAHLDFGPADNADAVDRDWAAAQFDGQQTLFEARRRSFLQELDQLAEQQRQIDLQVSGMTAQRAASERQLQIVGEELTGLQALLDRGLVSSARVLQLRREEAVLTGDIGRLTAAIAEARTRQAGLRIEALKRRDDRRKEAIGTLGDLQYAQIELDERQRSLTERLNRLDLRAPATGIVFGSTVFAQGAVIRPAAPIMSVIPSGEPLQVSVRIAPRDVDQVFAGQAATLMFTTFQRHRMPEISGVVVLVSADAARDDASGAAYYEAVVTPDHVALAALGDITLIPGMPVEVLLRTEDRTPIAYLTQPLTVYLKRAFREE